MPTILIIDDDEGLRWALENSLKIDGINTKVFASGREGLEFLSANMPDVKLVLLDIKLNNENGLQILEKIRDKNIGIPVLIMTGYSSMSIALDAITRGATGYLTKPLNIVHLREKLVKMFSNS